MYPIRRYRWEASYFDLAIDFYILQRLSVSALHCIASKLAPTSASTLVVGLSAGAYRAGDSNRVSSTLAFITSSAVSNVCCKVTRNQTLPTTGFVCNPGLSTWV